MNERIRELALQAGLYHKVNDNNFYPTNLSAEQSDPTYQKFAELIVRECFDVCERFGESGDGYTCSVEILEHFGVE